MEFRTRNVKESSVEVGLGLWWIPALEDVLHPSGCFQEKVWPSRSMHGHSFLIPSVSLALSLVQPWAGKGPEEQCDGQIKEERQDSQKCLMINNDLMSSLEWG